MTPEIGISNPTTYHPVEYPPYGLEAALTHELIRMNHSTIGIRYLMQKPQQKTKIGSHQALVFSFPADLPSMVIAYAIFLTPHIQISLYQSLRGSLEIKNEGNKERNKIQSTVKRSPSQIFSIAGKMIPKITTIPQKLPVIYRRDFLWFSDLLIVFSASNPHPHPAH